MAEVETSSGQSCFCKENCELVLVQSDPGF